MDQRKKTTIIICLILIVIISAGCVEQTTTTSKEIVETMQPSITTQTPRATQAPQTTTQTPETEAPTETPPSALTPGTVAIYFTQSLGSVSEELKGQYVNPTTGTGGGYQIDWTKTGYSVFRYVPESKELTLVKSIVSPSYAKHTIKPLTLDGSLYFATVYSTLISLDKLSPRDGSTISNSRLPFGSDSSYAILGDKVYYRESRECFGTSCSGGQLKIYDLNTGQSDILLNYGHKDNFGWFHSAGGNLYTVYNLKYQAPYDQEGWLIHRRDPNTFQVLETIADYTIYTNYEIKDFAFDQNAVYIETYNSNGAFELWKQDYVGGEPLILYTNTEDGEPYVGSSDRINIIDADDGYVLLNFYNGPTVIYDEHTNTAQKYELGLGSGKWVQILKIR